MVVVVSWAEGRETQRKGGWLCVTGSGGRRSNLCFGALLLFDGKCWLASRSPPLSLSVSKRGAGSTTRASRHSTHPASFSPLLPRAGERKRPLSLDTPPTTFSLSPHFCTKPAPSLTQAPGPVRSSREVRRARVAGTLWAEEGGARARMRERETVRSSPSASPPPRGVLSCSPETTHSRRVDPASKRLPARPVRERTGTQEAQVRPRAPGPAGRGQRARESARIPRRSARA